MTKLIVLLLAVFVFAGGAYTVISKMNRDAEVASTETDVVPTESSSAMRAENNMIMVSDQKPGLTATVSQISLAGSGFVVIRSDKNGAPADVLGASSLIQSSASSNIKITLSRESKENETLHAMLYIDTNSNGSFDASVRTIRG